MTSKDKKIGREEKLYRDERHEKLREEREAFYILLFCQGTIAIYSSELILFNTYVDRGNMFEGDDEINPNHLMMFRKSEFKNISKKVGPKNFLALSTNYKFLALNCYNTNHAELRFLDLDAFYSRADYWHHANNYLHATGVKYFNPFRRMNFITSLILSKIKESEISKDPSKKW